MNTQKLLDLDIVSAEAEIYKGKVSRLFLTGLLGELEIAPGHTHLLTGVLPGPVRFKDEKGADEVVYVTGGVLEVRPENATILADTVVRARDFNEAEAVKAKEQAQRMLEDKKADLDLARARAELTRAAGLLKAIQEAKRRSGRK